MHRWPIPIPPTTTAARLKKAVRLTATTLGLLTKPATTLKTLPNSLHWHLKQPNTPGTLELTFTPNPPTLVATTHENRRAPWIPPIVPRFRTLLRQCLATQ